MFSFFTLIRLSPASLSPTPINIKLTFQALELYLLSKVSLSTPVFTNYPFLLTLLYQGFPDSSVDKESTCNAGDSNSIPGSGRSAGERMGYPLQSSWASLVAQLVKKSACNVGDLRSIPGLGRFPWRRERLPVLVFWPGEFHVLYSPWSHKELDVTERLSFHFFKHYQNLSHHGYRLEGKDRKQDSLQIRENSP